MGVTMKSTIESDKFLMSVKDLSLSFGGVVVLTQINMTIFEGELLALIGPNGAGKTSLINCLTGFYQPQKGEICFKGEEISRFKSVKRSKMRIARTFQNIELFNSLSVQENLMAARHNHMSYGAIAGGIYFGRARRQEMHNRDKVEDIIDLMELASVRKKVVGSLPYGIRKRVDLARALASEPIFLLLDEPMAGMNTEEKEEMARFILDVQELWDTTIMIVEHDMGVVMDISDRIYVLDFGLQIAEGSPKEISTNKRVIKAYLGVEN